MKEESISPYCEEQGGGGAGLYICDRNETGAWLLLSSHLLFMKSSAEQGRL